MTMALAKDGGLRRSAGHWRQPPSGGYRGLATVAAVAVLGAAFSVIAPTVADAASFAFSKNNAASNDASGTSLAVQLTGVVAGDLIAVYVKYEGSTSTVTIGDGVDVFAADTAVNASNGDLHGQFFYALASQASGTVTYTATWAASKPYRKIFVYEYSHTGNVAAFDVSNRATATSGTLNSGAVTTTGTDEVVFASYGEYSGNNTSNEQIAGIVADQVRRQAFAAVWSKTFSSTVTGAATATGNSSTWISNIIAFKSTGPAEIVPPNVGITSPTAGSTVAGTVAVTATASDNVAVAGVQFKVDGVNLGAEDTSAPYSVNWDTTTATNADHTLTAIARDTSNNTATAAVTVTVFNAAPFNFALSNGGNKSVARSASVTNTITATLSAGATAPVAYTASGLPSGASATFTPTSCSPTCSTTMTITAGAATPLATSTLTVTGTAGALTRTTTFTLTVANAPDLTAPNVSLSAPSSGALLAGTNTVSATATDNVGVVGVQFLLDGSSLGAEDTTSPYSVSWNTTTATSGPHVLSATARDAAGNSATAANVAVTVDNQPPTGSVVINGGAAATNSTAATLTLSASDALSAVTQMRFSNTGSSFSAAEAYATTKAWTLSTGAGTKTVSAQFMDAAGNWSPSFTSTIVLDTTAPTISGVASSNVTSAAATISWATNEAATSQVEYGPTTAYGSSTPLDPTLLTSHSVALSGLTQQATYNYRARSKDAAGNERIGTNNTFRTTGIDNTAPSVPAGLVATPVSATQISLSWSASTDNVGVTGYDVFRDSVPLGTVSGRTFLSTGLAPATTYSYSVAARDAAGNVSAPSTPVPGTTLHDVSAPSIPANLAASAISARRIDLTWNASTDDVGVTGYNVSRDGVPAAAVATPGWSDTGLDPASAHDYTVNAFDAAGNTSATSLPAHATTLAVVAVSPTSLTAQVGSTTSFSCIVDDPFDTSCTWSVAEGATGGVVNSTGPTSASYTAPGSPGTYHVVAAGVADPTRSATATVTVAIAGTPALVQNVSSSTNPDGIGIFGNDFKFNLPNAVLAGNALVLKVAYEAGASFAATPITDSNGNVWPTVPAASVTDSRANVNLAVFVLPNANPGVTTLTVHFTAMVRPFQYDCSEWLNIATASPVSGSVGTSGVAGPTISVGSFTPANNDLAGGNLVLYYVHTDDDPGSGNSASSFAAGSGFTLLDADIAWGTDTNSYHASAYRLQPTAGPVNPSITVTTTPGNEHFIALAIALKAAAAGTAPLPGIRIVKLHHFTNEVPPSDWSIQFPTTGSNLVVAVTVNAPAAFNGNITSVTDNHGNTYKKTEPADDQPQWWVAEGATTGSDTKLRFLLNSGAAGMSMRLFEITGAVPSGAVDTAVGISGVPCSNLTSITGFPSITPASANGLTLAEMTLGNGPGLSVTSPAGALFDLVTYTGEIDRDTMENADALAHIYNSTTATQNFAWTFTSTPSNTCITSAIHLKAQ